jgi:FkbM family methyltransferase
MKILATNWRDVVDLAAICSTGGKGLRQTLGTLRQVNALSKHSASGRCDGFKFKGLDFECVDPKHFAFLFTEIFVAEPYLFSAQTRRPYIIDGGVNIGLSVAYFKKLFPESRIVGFEPHPQAYGVAKRNIERNRFGDVQLINAALAGVPGTLKLNFIPGEIMASTISNRLTVRGETPQTIEVPAVQISDYLSEEVDFLKLDIEGAENAVLEEAGNKLRNVRNMFVEYHQTRGDKTNSLSATISILERNGFDMLITSTLSNRKTASVAPLKKCGPFSSLLIFAKRVD